MRSTQSAQREAPVTRHTQFIAWAAASFLGLLMTLSLQVRADDTTPATTEPTEAWSRLPTAKWPQLVLTNEASFDGHTALHGASAFLMRMPDGEVLMGTAKHLIGEAGGVNPPVPLSDFDKVLQQWEVFPRTEPDSAIQARGLAEAANHESSHDWLLLHLADAKAKLPSAPLIPRLQPAEIGETIYLVGVPYSDRESAQNVYKGTVVSRPYKHFFKYEFTPPVHIEGFSGAPIVDRSGLLLGHGVSRFKLKQVNGREVEFGGEDANQAVWLWQHRHDPPATRPSDALHLTWPTGWAVELRHTGALAFGKCLKFPAFCELSATSKADFEDDVDLATWSKRIKASLAKRSKLANRQETELKRVMRCGRPAFQYDARGDSKNFKICYRIIMLESNECYCVFTFWTTPDHWIAAQPEFDRVVNALR